MLMNAKKSPDMTNYLAYLVYNEQAPPAVQLSQDQYTLARSAAALMLKNEVRQDYKSIPDTSKAYIQSVILLGLQDKLPQIRNYAGSVITEMLKQGGILGWPKVLSQLIVLVDTKDGSVAAHTQEGAMSALLKICEDNKRALEKEYSGERPLLFIIPKLLNSVGHPVAKVRALALAALNVFLPDKSDIVMVNLDLLMQNLFAIASDSHDSVRKYVCRTFIQIAEISPDRIVPHMKDLVDYILLQQQNVDDPDLALDAAEFWLTIGEADDLRATLAPYLEKIVPVLLQSMVYDEEDQLRLEAEQEEDAAQEDREEDIKPVFAKPKASRAIGANGEELPKNANGSNQQAIQDDDDLSEGEIEETDEDDDYGLGPEDHWNLRKCSAAALDVLATHFHEPVFAYTLPYLKDNLSHQDWPRREAAVLALGAIGVGCMDDVQPHLPELTAYLVTLLTDQEAVVRTITCWALGRYSVWASHLNDIGKQQYFEPIMDGILKRMLDGNKRVQEAAASAFATLEERAKDALVPYCSVIVRQFVECFARYQDRNMFILYDCVQTLAEHLTSHLATPELVNMLMPALIQRWSKLPNQSREILPLQECLSFIATALGSYFTPYAQPIFARCIVMIHENLQMLWGVQEVLGPYESEKDFIITSLDLLSAIIQAMDPAKSAQLVETSSPNLFELLAFCMKDPNDDEKQSAYALLGDCAICVFPQMKPYLPALFDILINQLDVSNLNQDADDTAFAVINNACWSAGEIAMRADSGLEPYVDGLFQKLAMILLSTTVPESLNENAALALGRMGISYSDKLAVHLAGFAAPFVRTIRNVGWMDEKKHAMVGFSKIVLRNPQAMEAILLDFFLEIASLPQPQTPNKDMGDLIKQFHEVLSGYKQLIPNFHSFLSHLPPEQAQKIRDTYQL
ncbi:ARM repeat-containing protein [Eremomyces bilateralis CBS 781.70]|uniref:ARM repeat-containing protein n=1 Tax=Eremomyces bilateralis CBS 781.70 TaxID=1392243 RepID=A0A6G1G1M7_9PEZI|nr:ARM repeat-containing protein [Eremomyces bilateralis CBS 781.70]KAF1811831.1 ARM repeat-containing protein [Eremomyces bilateralis CBS 781.70]